MKEVTASYSSFWGGRIYCQLYLCHVLGADIVLLSEIAAQVGNVMTV